jgi:elongation factor Ts
MVHCHSLLICGDKDKAMAILAKKAKEAAEKKSDRELGAGVIGFYVYGGGNAAALVELSCETDFVSKNEEFKTLANEIAFHVVAMDPTSINNEDGAGEETALLKQSFIKDPSVTIEQKIQAAIQKFGENTQIKRFVRYSI